MNHIAARVSRLHINKYCFKLITAAAIIVITILIGTLPMSLSPVWNGTIPDHRDQYERMAQSILHGHLYLEYEDIDPRLSVMENPYDPQARQELGIYFHWDHAFYNGKYYMYFGVVPVFLLFLPYQILTGNPLTTYKATQIFTAGTIIGIFLLFFYLRKKLFPRLPFGLCIALSMVLSFVSVWYAITAPALYCTAIMSAVCMEIISVNLMARVVWNTEQHAGKEIIQSGKEIIQLTVASLCAALAFGCRPTIALAGGLQIPMLYQYMRERKSKSVRIRACVAVAVPYLLTAALLMWYNYARFGSVWEFGQSYQLTVADQHEYSFWKEFRLGKILNGLMYQFASWTSIGQSFPYISYVGILIAFPVLLGINALVHGSVQKLVKEKRLLGTIGMLLILPICITVMDAIYTPYMVTRYQLDINFQLSIVCFLAVGFRYETIVESPRLKRRFCMCVWLLLVITLISFSLLLLVPYDGNATANDPQLLIKIENLITWWK